MIRATLSDPVLAIALLISFSPLVGEISSAIPLSFPDAISEQLRRLHPPAAAVGYAQTPFHLRPLFSDPDHGCSLSSLVSRTLPAWSSTLGFGTDASGLLKRFLVQQHRGLVWREAEGAYWCRQAPAPRFKASFVGPADI